MADNLGVATYQGVGIEVTYGTAVAATQMLNIISNGLDSETVNNQSVTLLGTSSRGRSRRGAEIVSGPIVVQWTYDTAEIWLEQFMGLRVPAVSPLFDEYQLQTRIDRSFTFAENKRDAVVHEYDGLEIATATLAGNANDGFRWTLDTLGNQRAITGTVNSAAGLQLLGIPAGDIHWEDMVLRIGELDDALASPADDFCPESISLPLNRNATHSIVNKRQPLRGQTNGHFDATLGFTLPRVDTDQFITWKEAGTLLQADITLSDGSSTKVVRFPVGRVTTAPQPTSGPELGTSDIELMFEHNRDGANANPGFDFEEAVRFFEDDGV